MRKGCTVFLALLFLIIFGFAMLTLCSAIGYREIFSVINNYQSISSTHQVEIGTDAEGYTTIKNITNDEALKVMQVTDMHICCSIATLDKDKMAFDAVYTAVEKNQPDLIVVTGDLIYPSLLVSSFNNELQAEAVGQFFEQIGIPWTLIYGNHDASATFTTASKTELSTYFSNLDNCLFQVGDENITGEGNYIIKALNNDGTLNKVLVFMDSNTYTGQGINQYDRIHDDQIQWYSDTLNSIASSEDKNVDEIYSLLFFHIPLTAYQTAGDLYMQGSDQVTKYFGEYQESINSSYIPEDFFSTITSLGSTRALFCGHDHLNNFCIKYQNVLLTYGMSIDYTAYIGIQYRTDQRGVTMIWLNENEDISVAQAPQDNNFIAETTGYNMD